MSRRSTALAAACAAAVALGPLAAPAYGAPPDGACRDPDPARPVVAALPWAQRLFGLERVWPHSTGAGVTVAVIDSGVDADHPQLRGRVLPGRDFFLVGELPGNFDCESHGTAVGSLIAGTGVPGVGFRGVAPGARILPVRVSDRELADDGAPTPIDADVVARGIRYAVDEGAQVINLSLSGYGDHRAIREAVAYALRRDVLLVASAGNRQEDGGGASFPAAYDGVLGVGGIDIAGARSRGSQLGPHVDLVAPGEAVLAATRVGGHAYWTGTSFAAPFVAGTAALVRSAYPDLTAAEAAERIVATAAPARGGRDSAAYGAGVVDPYRAVTERLADAGPLEPPAVTDPPVDGAAQRELAWWAGAGAGAKLGAGLVVLAIAVAGIAAVALPRGRRRRWLPTRPAPLPAAPARTEPPDEVFLFPPPPVEQVRTHR
jgi:membrane-anchored mycosin MYCP